jgi:hypothetical protein
MSENILRRLEVPYVWPHRWDNGAIIFTAHVMKTTSKSTSLDVYMAVKSQVEFFSEILLYYCNTTRHHIPQELDLKLLRLVCINKQTI